MKSIYIHAGNRKEAKRLESQSRLFQNQLRPTFKLLGITKNTAVLEVGCGSGAVSREIARKVSPATAVAVDIDSVFLREARLVASRKGIRNLIFERRDAHHLEYAANSFDITFCRLLLMHLENPLKAVSEMKRVTKRGGRVGVWEIDDGASFTYPRLVKGEKLARRIKLWLKKNYSIDREMGRKLNSILLEAGLKRVTVHSFPVCMSQRGSQISRLSQHFQFSPQIAPYKKRLVKDGVMTEEELEAADTEGRIFAESPSAFALFSSFLAIGEK